MDRTDPIGIEAERARRFEANLSVLLLEIDGFAAICAEQGAAAGEDLRRQVAGLLRKNLRKIDVFGDWPEGGFVVLTVDRNAEGAGVVAEKLRRLAADGVFDCAGQARTLTISVGVSQGIPQDEAQIDTLVESARAARDRARAAGGNRVERL